MAKTVQDVKFAIHPIIDKVAGFNKEPFTEDEYEALVFALESNILFDNVAYKFLPSLQSIPVVPELELNEGLTDEDKQLKRDEFDMLTSERSDMIKTIFITMIKENIFREMSVRFGS